MAEPQFLFGEIPLSRAAFDRWLKSTPPSAPHWHEWSDSTFWLNDKQQTVAQALIPFFLAAPDIQRCMLVHDKGMGVLRCALWLQYQEMGDDLMCMVALLRSIAPFMAAKTQAVVYHGENVSGALTFSGEETAWVALCSPLSIPFWADDWINSLPELQEGVDPAWVDSKLFNQIKRDYNHYLIHATPEKPVPFRKAGYYHYDGTNVISSYGVPIPDANPLTFKCICHDTFTDIYTDGCGVWIDCSLIPLSEHSLASGLRPEQIKLWNGGYDESFLLQTADKTWFLVRNLHEYELRSQRIDPATFRKLTWSQYADKDHFYIFNSDGLIVHPVSVAPGKIKMFDNLFVLAGNQVLCDGKILPGADANSFRKLGSGYYCDDHSVWYEEHLKEGVDPATFILIDNDSGLAVDAKHVFMKKEDFPEADPKTIEIIAHRRFLFWKDKNHAWYGFNKLQGAHLELHAMVLYPESLYCRIGDRIWCEEREMVDVDIDSFTVTAWGEAHDKNGPWYFGRRMENE
ncbi:DKNYY domain-containing protein [Serratia fonticola]|uniref:DKNYY domain-containing protein n=1 Tax=Serratia fonticola TaxID=47917 RepID=UPI00192CA351|nr:DKNYY domain-containing protein [Serratia fonticola]MBL5906847.1 DKNYY domain-containing protein [Serratia fonticola]